MPNVEFVYNEYIEIAQGINELSGKLDIPPHNLLTILLDSQNTSLQVIETNQQFSAFLGS